MGWVLSLSHLCMRRLHIRYDEPVAPTERSRAGATWSAVVAGVRQFWQGYWRSPRGC
jgi:hypothetical protein